MATASSMPSIDSPMVVTPASRCDSAPRMAPVVVSFGSHRTPRTPGAPASSAAACSSAARGTCEVVTSPRRTSPFRLARATR